jgi:hypothetical protein
MVRHISRSKNQKLKEIDTMQHQPTDYIRPYLYEYVTEHTFIDAFRNSAERKEEFSYEALKELFKYYDNLAEDTGEPIQFDMVAICCEWSEYDSLEELEEAYDMPLKALEDNTIVLRFTYHSFMANLDKPTKTAKTERYLIHEF